MKIQYRGNCPCCGHLQAVLKNGKMAKHGYTVEDGWFNGVCPGSRYAPMQVERTVAEGVIKTVKQDVEVLLKEAAELENGVLFPSIAVIRNPKSTNFKDRYISIPFNDATIGQQKIQVSREISEKSYRARQGETFAKYMEKLLNEVFNTPLIEVNVEVQKLAQILRGETRISPKGRIMIVTSVTGHRVYWKTDIGGFKGWTGTTSWRKFEIVK